MSHRCDIYYKTECIYYRLLSPDNMASNMSDTTKSLYHIKKLSNEGNNYALWSSRCRIILKQLKVWDVVNPSAPTSTRPTPSAPTPSSTPLPPAKPATPGQMAPLPAADPIAEWDEKNTRAYTNISLTLEDTPFHLIMDESSVRDAWVALAKHYCGIGAHDTSVLKYHLHQIQLDDSKLMEPQINQMCDLHSQLATIGHIVNDSEFVMIS